MPSITRYAACAYPSCAAGTSMEKPAAFSASSSVSYPVQGLGSCGLFSSSSPVLHAAASSAAVCAVTAPLLRRLPPSVQGLLQGRSRGSFLSRYSSWYFFPFLVRSSVSDSGGSSCPLYQEYRWEGGKMLQGFQNLSKLFAFRRCRSYDAGGTDKRPSPVRFFCGPGKEEES